ncbi:DUF4175 family protein [Gimesia panareensis]|uniref:DUF4175 family protein n=1 Tax=Gimesia panareensis TaxID=2527978 RepID=UPI00118A4884|nr:DUF4175 family protein [Gimesia panareensis]QDU50014.1 hypothetical protein Pan110_23560 [Gimesia panareensis]
MGLPELLQQLNQVIFRQQLSLKLKRLTLLWLVAGCLTLLTVLLLPPVTTPTEQAALLGILLGLPFCIAVAMLVYRQRNRYSPAGRHAIATLIEQTYPDLDTSLLATLELEKRNPTESFTFLQKRLIAQVISHGTRNDWRQSISNRRLILQNSTHLICFAAWLLCCLSCWTLLQAAPSPVQAPAVVAETKQPGFEVEIQPGSTEVELGHPLLVTARFIGKVPDTATLRFTTAGGTSTELPLVKQLDDPIFAVRLPSVTEDLTYRIQAADWESEVSKVKVYVLPELVQLDSVVTAPAYTGQPEQKNEDSLTLSAITGSTIQFHARFNKPVARAEFKTDDGQALPLVLDSEGLSARLSLQAEQDQTWSLQLTDRDGRHNRTPPYIDLAVIPNLPPEIKVTFPARDTRVSPLEEALVQGTVVDDFGLQQVGLVYAIPGQEPQTVVLRDSQKPAVEFTAEHLLSLERLHVQPDTLISYYLFAEDLAAEGRTRKVLSDMYFMEVRHFEEIFREGRSPGGGSKSGKSGGNAQQAEKLAEQQKQIINATWKVIRREIQPTVSEQFDPDLETLAQAQQSLVAALLKLSEKIKSQKSKALIDTISQKMQEVVVQLNSAREAKTVTTLTTALAAEQASYQLLLKLRAREHEVSKNKNGGGSKGGGSNRSQNQLQQLELTNKKQRYETENQASQSAAAQPDRETLQILNRLRELAERQKDLNEQLKELASKQRFAKTDEEREEIERQLKRLRDRQRELLRQADEVAQRMDQAKQPDSAKSRRELEQTRQHLQQSAQSLKEGQVSRALNSGTRAQQKLNQLKNDFRKKSANQFADAMRSLNQQAEQLDKQQKALNQALNGEQKPEPGARRSLRKKRGNQELAEQLQQQEERLKNLMEQMKQIVQESEKSEPLLSKHLYDAIRKTRPFRPEDALKDAASFLKEGDDSRARAAEAQASRGIETMKQGIQVAAESVLGNDLESLKRARQALKSLTSEMKQEEQLASNSTGQQAPRGSSGKPGEQGPQQADPKSNSKQAQGPGKPGQPQSGQPKQGQPQQGQSNQKQNGQNPSQSGKGQSKSGPSKSGPSQGGQSKQGQPGQGQPGGGKPGSSGQPSPQESPQVQLTSAQAGQGQGSQSGSPNSSPQRSSAPRSLKGQRGQSQGGSGGSQGGGPGSPNPGPLTGNQFREWSDRMRDVEEMVGDPELRSRVAQIRERAQSMRAEFKRHSKVPEGDLIHAQILEPLAELQAILSNEISKRGAQTSLAPIDRDPVPEKYSDLVRRYYEELGNGK